MTINILTKKSEFKNQIWSKAQHVNNVYPEISLQWEDPRESTFARRMLSSVEQAEIHGSYRLDSARRGEAQVNSRSENSALVLSTQFFISDRSLTWNSVINNI